MSLYTFRTSPRIPGSTFSHPPGIFSSICSSRTALGDQSLSDSLENIHLYRVSRYLKSGLGRWLAGGVGRSQPAWLYPGSNRADCPLPSYSVIRTDSGDIAVGPGPRSAWETATSAVDGPLFAAVGSAFRSRIQHVKEVETVRALDMRLMTDQSYQYQICSGSSYRNPK